MPEKLLDVQRLTHCFRLPGAVLSGRWMICPFSFFGVRYWALWGSPAAESPRWPAAS